MDSQQPAYAHEATDIPIEGYLDESFIHRTSPRLNQGKVNPNQEPLRRQPNKVVKDGTVVCEVVTRHRVMNRDGRDYGATVQVVVPAPLIPYEGRAEHEKVVAMMNCPGGQASEIAVFVGDAIAAMVEENLMVSEEEQNKERKQHNQIDISQCLGKDPLAPSADEVMQDVMADLKAGYITAKDAAMYIMDASSDVKDMLPFLDMLLTEMGSHPDKNPDEVQQLRELAEKLKQMYGSKEEDGPSIKDEAADTQGASVPVREGDVARMAEQTQSTQDGNV